MTYATAADYAAIIGQPYPGDWDAAEILRIDAGLANASSDIDAQIYLARYDATDAATLDVLKRAAVARFKTIEATGDDGEDSLGGYDSVRVGPVSLSRSTDRDTVQTDELVRALGARAAAILRTGGFIVSGVFHS